MNNISSVAAGATQAPIVRDLAGVKRAGDCVECGETRPATPEIRTRAADTVDFSELARRLAQRPTDETLRPELVNRIRAELDSGEYDTPEKLDIALDRMIDRLD